MLEEYFFFYNLLILGLVAAFFSYRPLQKDIEETEKQKQEFILKHPSNLQKDIEETEKQKQEKTLDRVELLKEKYHSFKKIFLLTIATSLASIIMIFIYVNLKESLELQQASQMPFLFLQNLFKTKISYSGYFLFSFGFSLLLYMISEFKDGIKQIKIPILIPLLVPYFLEFSTIFSEQKTTIYLVFLTFATLIVFYILSARLRNNYFKMFKDIDKKAKKMLFLLIPLILLFMLDPNIIRICIMTALTTFFAVISLFEIESVHKLLFSDGSESIETNLKEKEKELTTILNKKN